MKKFKIIAPVSYLEHFIVEAKSETEAKDLIYFADPEDREQFLKERVHNFDDDLSRWKVEEL